MQHAIRKRGRLGLARPVLLVVGMLGIFAGGVWTGSALQRGASAHLGAAQRAAAHSQWALADAEARAALRLLPFWDRRSRAVACLVLAQAPLFPTGGPGGPKESEQWARRAVQLAPDDPQPQAWVAIWLGPDAVARKQAAERALALDRGTLSAYQRTELFAILERWTEVVKAGGEAITSDPSLLGLAQRSVAQAFEQTGQPDKATAIRELAQEHGDLVLRLRRLFGERV